MAEIDNLVINVEVRGDTKDLNNIALLIEKLGTTTQKTNTKVSKFGTTLKKVFSSAIFIQAARFLGDAVNKSMGYTESLNLFTVAMGDYADEAKKYAETVSEVMGIDPADWLKAQGTFNILATGFGVTADKAAIMSKNLTQLGYDISSFYELSVSDAMTKLQSGLAGELEPLRRLGYDLSVARLQQEAYALGIDKSITAMNQAEKSMLRYHAIMSQVTEAQGDMARTLESPANQTRILKAQVAQLTRSIGNVLIPVINKLLPYLIAMAQMAREAADSLALFFGFTLPEVDYSSASDSVGDIATDLEDANDSAKELKRTLMGFDEINKLNASKSGSSDNIGGGVGFDMELLEYDFLGNRLAQNLDDVKAKVEEIGKYVAIVGAGFAAWKLTKFIADLLIAKEKLDKFPTKMAIGITLSVVGIALEVKGIISAIQTELNKTSLAEILAGGGLTVAGAALIGKQFGSALLGGGIGAVVAGLPMYIVGIYDAITKEMNWMNAALIASGSTMAGAGIGAIIGSLGGPIGTGIGALIGLVVGALTDIGILIYQKWDEITAWWKTEVSEPFKKEWAAMWEEEKAIFVTLWNDIKTNATGAWNGMKSEFSSAWNEIKTSATNTWNNITSSIKSNFAEIVNGARTELTELKNLFTNWKATIKTPHFEWSTTPLPSSDWRYKVLDALSLPTQIPKLNVNWYAQGGFPSQGELFVAREAGAEMVGAIGRKTTVANNQQIVDGIYKGVYQAMRDSGGNNGGQRIVVMLPNGDVLGETVVNWHNGVVKQTGYTPLLV